MDTITIAGGRTLRILPRPRWWNLPAWWIWWFKTTRLTVSNSQGSVEVRVRRGSIWPESKRT